MTTFQKYSFFIWILSLVVFFLILSLVALSQREINDYEGAGLATVFVIGIFSFFSMFIGKSFFQIPLVLISSLNRKISKKLIIISSIIVTIFLFFYWFQVRPAQIKTSCQKESDDYITREFDREDTDKDGLISQESIDWLNSHAKRKYERCLHRNGL
ncbi:MAG: hypothetical protein AAB492_03630 [Patescibacteria group bacterium]